MFRLTFEDIRRRVKIGVDRDDLDDLYNDYINQGIREIENRCSFNYMKKASPITILNGDLTVSMPDDFKELVRQTSPVVQVVTPPNPNAPAVFPCQLYSRQQMERLNSAASPWIFAAPQEQLGRRLNLIVDVENGVWFLSLLSAATADVPLRVNYYGYSEEIVSNDPEHPLFTYYPNLVVSATKYMIFQDINDPQKIETEQEFERQLLKAKGTDRTISFAGFDSHM